MELELDGYSISIQSGLHVGFLSTGSTYHLSSLSHAFDVFDDFFLLSLQFPPLPV